MRLSLLAPSLALASFVAAQSSHLSEEQRNEIRTLIRDEIRAAMKEHLAPATTAKTMTFAAPSTTSTTDTKPHTFQWTAVGQPAAGATKAKAYRVSDGKMQEVDLADITDSQGSFRVQAHGDGEHAIQVVTSNGKKQDVVMLSEPKGRARVLSLTPTSSGESKIEFVVAKDAEKQAVAECCKALEAANECCEAVKVVTKNGEKAECCEGGECVIEVQAKPAKAKAKKSKKAKKDKTKDDKTEMAEKLDDVTEMKITEVLEKLAR